MRNRSPQANPAPADEQEQLLALHNTGHCGVSVTANYDPEQWERCQNILSQATTHVVLKDAP
ncbi:hypothetical protein H8F21_14365 [Pseudomonas sp. P66]|uniref:Uncharacterized protein n=1 Tax=Pseudomonas arcuscaelestis TaxID=2710591 RepID=A0ABS2BYQ2_9PSED|nr:hypothetical protein [Pseudomonas arcuscaelestis]MBM5458748.1 hypothetical protein [Pseudomonas arcuscaelestis]